MRPAEQPGGGFLRFRDSWLGLMMLGFEETEACMCQFLTKDPICQKWT